MNIAAWRAAVAVYDLDVVAKHALQVICGYLARPPAVGVDLSITRLAVAMGAHYNTAQRALVRLVDAGYVTVEHRTGRSTYIVLNFDNLARRGDTDLARTGRTPRAERSNTSTSPRDQLEYLDTYGSGGRPPSPNGSAPAANGNGAAPAPAHPDDCACAGTGWIEHPAGVVRCSAPARQRSRTTTRTRR